MPTFEFQHLSPQGQIALTQFVEDFATALSQEASPADEWAKGMGLFVPQSNPSMRVQFPIPISAVGYRDFDGDVRYRQIFQRTFELQQRTWQDGVAELASVIEAPDFIGWPGQAAAMAAAARALPNEIISLALETNAVHPLDNLTFFNTAHPINVLDTGIGTFANTFTGAGTAASTTALETAKSNLRKVRAANGKPLGLRMTHVLCHPDREETWRNILDRDLIIQGNPDAPAANAFGAVTNRHKGTVQLIVSDQVTVSNQWYAIALNKPGTYPWALVGNETPETLLQDKTGDLYKTTLKVGMASVLRMNGGLALPHCIHRYVGA